MFWANSDQIRSAALRVAFSALFFTGCINACFAQEPPLTVPLAGRLPGPGCDAGLGGNSPYANANLYGNASPAANANTSGNSGLGSNAGLGGGNAGLGGITSPSGNAGLGGLGGNANSGGNTSPDGNFPLYSDQNLYGNFPLYSNPDVGSNIPLYTTSDFYRNSRLDSGSTLGGYAGLRRQYPRHMSQRRHSGWGLVALPFDTALFSLF